MWYEEWYFNYASISQTASVMVDSELLGSSSAVLYYARSKIVALVKIVSCCVQVFAIYLKQLNRPSENLNGFLRTPCLSTVTPDKLISKLRGRCLVISYHHHHVYRQRSNQTVSTNRGISRTANTPLCREKACCRIELGILDEFR